MYTSILINLIIYLCINQFRITGLSCAWLASCITRFVNVQWKMDVARIIVQLPASFQWVSIPSFRRNLFNLIILRKFSHRAEIQNHINVMLRKFSHRAKILNHINVMLFLIKFWFPRYSNEIFRQCYKIICTRVVNRHQIEFFISDLDI